MITAPATDLLRLVVVPAFGWAAWRDIKTRRIANAMWPPLVGLGVVILCWDVARILLVGEGGAALFAVRVAVSMLVVGPLGYVLWWVGAFGAADAKAIITLSILLPTFPSYTVGGATLPLVDSAVGVFSLTVLTNALVCSAVVPVWIGLTNAVNGRFEPATLFVARPVSIETLADRHGRLFETSDGTRGDLDLDVLRRYLQWRGLSLAELRAGRDHIRDGGDVGDPWAAAEFLTTVDKPTYGADANQLRDSLEVVAATDREQIWVSPGLPFFVPLFAGLLVGVVYGDLLGGFVTVIG